MGLDRGINKRSCPSFRRLGSRILRQVLWRLRFHRWYYRRNGRWCGSGICHHGVLYMYENGGDHPTQNRGERGCAPEHFRHLHGHLQKGRHPGNQQGRQCRCHPANHQLGISLRPVTAGGDGHPTGHGQRRQPEAQFSGEDCGQRARGRPERLEPAHRSDPSGNAEQDRRSEATQKPDRREDAELHLLQQWDPGLVPRCLPSYWPRCLADDLYGRFGRHVSLSPPPPPPSCSSSSKFALYSFKLFANVDLVYPQGQRSS